MTKRLSEKEKKEISKFFISGKTIEQLSSQFNCSKLTISRNIKKDIGLKKYDDLIKKSKNKRKVQKNKEQIINPANSKEVIIDDVNLKNTIQAKNEIENLERDFSPLTTFAEIIPLDYEIENAPRKDLSSVPISDVTFPKMVYMIVDKKIELETKFLKDYPQWDFLSNDELSRKTIEIYDDLKIAKRFCNKEQKVIKVPNTDVFRIVSPILISRGISRIISAEKLIAL